MALVQADSEGVRDAARALDAREPVVLPLPTPLPYVVAGTDAAAVNEAKGRPGDQPAGMAVSEFALVASHTELDPESLALARWLTAHELLNVFVPVAEEIPAWLEPSTSKGWLGLTLAWLDELRPLLTERGHIYLSSANRTRQEVAVTAREAEDAFAGALLVVDGDAHRDPSVPCGSATMVRVRPNRHVELLRHGIQDAERPLEELLRRAPA